MTSFFRPAGVKCSNWVYADKDSPYVKFKKFLFEQNTGRTDVIFFSSAASGLETKIDEDTSTSPHTYHCVGGLIDGIAKAIIVGNPSINRPGRSLYATSVKLGYESNVVPGYNRFNSNTWNTPNTTGAGGFLAGTSVAYDSYFYYTRGTKNQTGYSYFSLPVYSGSSNQVQSQYNPETDQVDLLSWKDFWATATFGMDLISVDELTVSSPLNQKLKGQRGSSFFGASSILTSNISYFQNRLPVTLSQTPEQPQRFWDVLNPVLISKNKQFKIGVGYIENGIVTEVFQTHRDLGYAPTNVVAVGMTEAQVIQNGLSIISLSGIDDLVAFTTNPVAEWYGMEGVPASLKLDDWNILFASVRNKKLIIRTFTTEQIVAIRNLNINPNTPTTEGEYNSFDGYLYDQDTYLLRWMWANPQTISGPDTNSRQSLATQVIQTWGLALRSVDVSVSVNQNGLPYLRTFGTSSHLYTNCGFHITDYSCDKQGLITLTETNPQIPGYPLTLSSINPCGFFLLTKDDTPELTGTSPSPTIFKDRCMLVRPSLGKVFGSIISSKGGLQPISRELTTTEKNNLLGIFKSPDFFYVCSVFTIENYSGAGASRKSNVAPISSSQITYTAHAKTIGSGNTLTQIRAPFTNDAYAGNQIVLFPTVDTPIEDKLRRKVYRQVQGIPVNLQAVNSDWSKSELRFGFLGKGTANITGGNLAIGIQYGIDIANQHGISFTKGESKTKFRSGDAAYNYDNGMNSGRGLFLAELLLAIKERQQGFDDTALNEQTTGLLLNGINTKKKLIIFYEIGIWEESNPNSSYLGHNAYKYLLHEKTGLAANGVYFNNGLAVNSVFPITNLLKLCGYSDDEYVIVFYTPAGLTQTNLPSKDTDNPPENAIYSNNNRSLFTRSSEIFVNNSLAANGLYNNPWINFNNNVTDTSFRLFKNSFYVNLGSIPTIINALSDANVLPNEEDWYVNDGEVTDFTKFTPEGNLAIGQLFIDYIYTAGLPSVQFVPPWLPPFSRMLNYTTDPVSGSNLDFVTISTDPIDIEPYLVSFDALCDQGNIQAKRTLSRYKTKILQ
jgi:hypothetical protein